MTPEIIEQYRTAGLTDDQIAALQEYHAIRATVMGGKGGNTAVSNNKSLNTTAVDNQSGTSDYNRVRDIAYTLFGGFGPGQIRYLLRFTDADTIVRIMFELRSQHWSRGWVRTRDRVTRLKVA